MLEEEELWWQQIRKKPSTDGEKEEGYDLFLRDKAERKPA